MSGAAGKLTGTQRAVLAKLATEGEFIHMLCGIGAHAFWHGDASTVRTSTVEALRLRGLIASTRSSALGSLEYRITPAGRAAVEDPAHD